VLTLAATDDDGAEAGKHMPQQKPGISEQGFKKALDAITNGSYTAEQLRSNYSLTKEQEAQL
jgi:hypothetical protein